MMVVPRGGGKIAHEIKTLCTSTVYSLFHDKSRINGNDLGWGSEKTVILMCIGVISQCQ